MTTAEDRPRLLVLASTYPRWADDTEPRFVHELSRRLARRYHVTALVPHTRLSAPREVIDGVNIVRFRYAPASLECLAYNGGILANLRGRPWTWILVIPFLSSQLLSTVLELRRAHYTAIHAHWLVPQGMIAILAVAFARRPRPVVLCTSHGGDLFGLRGSIGRFLKRFVITKSDGLSVVSHAMKSVVKDLVTDSPSIHVLPMGTDLSTRFTPSINIERRTRLILFVGRLVEKKGVSHLVDAFNLLRPREPSARLRVIGDGPLRKQLEAQVARLGLTGSIEFVGAIQQDRIPNEMRRAAVLVMPSIRASDGDEEGLGLVQVEAMGCGCPVISSDLPAVHDVITHEKTGLLVPPGDAKALSIAILRLMDDTELRAHVTANAIAHVRKCFDWNIVADRYANVIGQLAKDRRAQSESNRSR